MRHKFAIDLLRPDITSISVMGNLQNNQFTVEDLKLIIKNAENVKTAANLLLYAANQK